MLLLKLRGKNKGFYGWQKQEHQNAWVSKNYKSHATINFGVALKCFNHRMLNLRIQECSIENLFNNHDSLCFFLNIYLK